MSFLRITGGDFRSRRVKVIDAPGLRPTPDAVRVTLFNWLGQDLTGWRCLDLFAGSGILGLECASRGAAEVTFVERDRRIHAELAKTLADFAHPALLLERGDALEFLLRAKTQGRLYDLVLLDPPYGQGWIERIVPHLPPVMHAEGKIYLECERRLDDLPSWRIVRAGRAGQVFYHLLEQA